MLEAYGNIWDLAPDYDAVVITTNGFVKKNGEAVMGRGIAKEAVERFPEFPQRLGNMLRMHANNVFGFSWEQDPKWYITLPVKPAIGPNGEPGWRARAQIPLIEDSIKQVVGTDGYYGVLRNIQDSGGVANRILMPRPGCGNGGLKWEDVKPVIEPLLDDRFTVVTFHP